MAIVMSAGETDDPGFIEVLNSILSELIAEHAPEEFWFIQIDNLFDHKWLGFSGTGLIASNIPLNTYHTVKAESYREKVTFPPFPRNRLVGQFSFVRVANSYTESALPALPDSNERKHSETNFRRRIQDFTRLNLDALKTSESARPVGESPATLPESDSGRVASPLQQLFSFAPARVLHRVNIVC